MSTKRIKTPPAKRRVKEPAVPPVRPSNSPAVVLTPADRLTLHELNGVRYMLERAEGQLLHKADNAGAADKNCQEAVELLIACTGQLNRLIGVLHGV